MNLLKALMISTIQTVDPPFNINVRFSFQAWRFTFVHIRRNSQTLPSDWAIVSSSYQIEFRL
jgi:hypothetical protein